MSQLSTASNKTTARYRAARDEAIRHYGGKCQTCGIAEQRYLTLDHIEDDGNRHRRFDTTALQLGYWAVKNGFPPSLQCLCWNCNHKKHLALVRSRQSQSKTAVTRRNYGRQLRLEVMEAYGGPKCHLCGDTELDVLVIGRDPANTDHRSSAQRIKNKSGTIGHYLDLRRNGFPPGYRVSCWNCNCGRFTLPAGSRTIIKTPKQPKGSRPPKLVAVDYPVQFKHGGEILRQIPGFDGTYYASKRGSIWSIRNRGVICQPHRLQPRPHPVHGQITVTLYRKDSRYLRTQPNGKRVSSVRPIVRKVKSLIASVWMAPAPSPTHHLYCRDGDQSNCAISNLRYGTATEIIRLRNRRLK